MRPTCVDMARAIPQELRNASVDDYVEDVARAAASLDADPVVIGHSMGGFVVQRYLEKRQRACGAALLAPAPPWGVGRATLNIARRFPLLFLKVNLQLSLWPLVSSEALIREHFFREDIAPEELAAHASQVGDESYRAFIDMLALVRPKALRRVPVFVLGGTLDKIFRVEDVRGTAARHGAEAEIIDDLAHDVMLDPCWPDAAAALHTWLETTFA